MRVLQVSLTDVTGRDIVELPTGCVSGTPITNVIVSADQVPVSSLYDGMLKMIYESLKLEGSDSEPTFIEDNRRKSET